MGTVRFGVIHDTVSGATGGPGPGQENHQSLGRGDEVLTRLRSGGHGLVLLWWTFAMTAALLAPVAILMAGRARWRIVIGALLA